MGFAAFVLLVPLAATSNNAIIKRIGCPPVAAHSLRGVSDRSAGGGALLVAGQEGHHQPAIYAAVFFLLLALRLFWKLRDVTQGRNAGDSKRRPIENQRA